MTDGIIIDHLPPWSALELIEVLGLRSRATKVCALLNEEGDHCEKKDILKVEHFAPEFRDFQIIALKAPEACITFVERGAKARKVSPTLGPYIDDILLCSNAECITKVEEVPHRIRVLSLEDLPFQCHYCQTHFSHKELVFAP